MFDVAIIAVSLAVISLIWVLVEFTKYSNRKNNQTDVIDDLNSPDNVAPSSFTPFVSYSVDPANQPPPPIQTAPPPSIEINTHSDQPKEIHSVINNSSENLPLQKAQAEANDLREQLSYLQGELYSVQLSNKELKELNDQLINDNRSLNSLNSSLNQQLSTHHYYQEHFEIELERKLQESIQPSLESIMNICNANYDISALLNGILECRLENAFSTDLELQNLNISAEIKSGNELYKVTPNSCSCKDREAHTKGFACKHQLFLAYNLGILQLNKDKAKKMVYENFEKVSEESNKIKLLKKEAEHQEEKNKKLKKVLNDYKKEFDIIASKTVEDLPFFASIIAEYKTKYYEEAAIALQLKKRPAFTESYRIKDLRKDTQKILAEKLEYEYKLSYIESMFPNINDIFDSGFSEEQQTFALESRENTDPVRFFISGEDYRVLSVTEKNQLALDRYIEGRKSKWQIGRDYEMYIGYHCAKFGYHVTYTGIIQKLEDMGRDLIAKKGDKTYIIQCKRWSKEKTIHEKHIFQLFGTVILYNIDHPKHPALGVFVSTTQLSPKAQKIAKELNIQVLLVEAGDFPRIKCNINRTTGEKIYHLPFDQQYDSVVIDEFDGECYAFTVKEAEGKGFRRAFKHFST